MGGERSEWSNPRVGYQRRRLMNAMEPSVQQTEPSGCGGGCADDARGPRHRWVLRIIANNRFEMESFSILSLILLRTKFNREVQFSFCILKYYTFCV